MKLHVPLSHPAMYQELAISLQSNTLIILPNEEQTGSYTESKMRRRTVANSKENLPDYLQVRGQRIVPRLLWGRAPHVLSGDEASHTCPPPIPAPNSLPSNKE